MRAEASDTKGAVLFHQEPHFSRSSSGATILEDEGDEDVHMDADMDVAKAHLHLLHAPLMSITAGRVPEFAAAHPAAGRGNYTPRTPGKHPNATVF
jgi:hypothetical protein